MQKETYELFEKKFLKDCSAEEKIFLKEINAYRNVHEKKARENKEKYFNDNLILISLLSGNKILKIIFSILVTIVSAVGVTKIIEMCLEFSDIAVTNKISLVIFLCVGFIILGICIYFLFLLEKKQKELPFRRYGETWVRHTVALSEINEEILKYLCDLDCYKEKNNKKKKVIFMEKILEIESKNMDKFQSNMRKIE